MNVLMLCGSPGAGKTTLAESIVREKRYIRLSADEIRKELTGSEEYNPEDTLRVIEILHGRLVRLLQEGHDVVVDVTNARPEWRSPLIAISKAFNATALAVVFGTSLKECLHRNRNRTRVVDEGALRRYWLWCRNDPPQHEEGIEHIIAYDGHNWEPVLKALA